MNNESRPSAKTEPMTEEGLRRLERDVRRLKRYGAGVTLLLGVVSLAAFQQAARTRFTELDVERLNVVEKDGTTRLAIANPERMPPVTFYGKEYPGIREGSAPGGAGMIYFNEEGTEAGGYGWRGRKTDTGHRAAGLLTFDQYNQGETIALSYADEDGRRRAGLTVYDQPDISMQALAESLLVIRQIPDSAERARRMQRLIDARRDRGEVGYRTRLYAGKDRSKTVMVRLDDPQGRPRLRLSVDSLGAPKLEFLDEQGNVTHALAGSAR